MKKQVSKTYEILRDKIVSGEYYPSQRLVETKLAKVLDTSRDHIRMAFQRLDADGLIELNPNQGATVTVVTLEDILDVLVALEALELEAYRRAVMRMTDDMLQQLEDLVEKMEKAIQDTDYELYTSSSMRFRNTLIEAAESPRLRELVETMRLTGNRIRLRSIIIPLRGHSSLAEHERIMEAIRKADLNELEAAFRHHMESVRRDTEKHWDFIRP